MYENIKIEKHNNYKVTFNRNVKSNKGEYMKGTNT